MYKKMLLLMAIILSISTGLFAETDVDNKLFDFDRKVDNTFIRQHQTGGSDYINNFFAMDVNKDQATGDYYGIGVDKGMNAAYYFDENNKTNYFAVNPDTQERALSLVDKVAITKSGKIYIIDAIEETISCWDNKGDSFKTIDKIYCDFKNLEDIYVDKDDNLFILDNAQKRIYKYSTEINDFVYINNKGDFYISFKDTAFTGWGNARGIIADDNYVYVLFERGHILKLDNNGEIVNKFAFKYSNIGLMVNTNKDVSPTWMESIALGPLGNIYVLDSKAGSVHILTSDLEFLTSWKDPEHPIDETASDICFAKGALDFFITHSWGFYSYALESSLVDASINNEVFYPDYVCEEYPGLNMDISVIGSGIVTVKIRNIKTSEKLTIAEEYGYAGKSSLVWDAGNWGSFNSYGEYSVEFYFNGVLAKEDSLVIKAPPVFSVEGMDDQIIDKQNTNLTYSIKSDTNGFLKPWITSENSNISGKRIFKDQEEEFIIGEDQFVGDLPDGEYTINFSVLPYYLPEMTTSGFYKSKQIFINKTYPEISGTDLDRSGINPDKPGFTDINCTFTSNEGVYVDVSIVDEAGGLVRKIGNETYLDSGTHTFSWNGKNSQNSSVLDGKYQFVLQIRQRKPDFTLTRESLLFDVDTTAPIIKFSEESKNEYYISPDEPTSKYIKDDIGITQNQNVLSFSYNEESYLSARVLNNIGGPIKTLFDDNYYTAEDKCSIQWDGRDGVGQYVPDGKYIISVESTDIFDNKVDNEVVVWVDNNKEREGAGNKIINFLGEKNLIATVEKNIENHQLMELGDNLLLVWEEYNSTRRNVYGQIFNNDGIPLFDKFYITYARNAHVTTYDSGFAISYKSDFNDAICFQRYNILGVEQGEIVTIDNKSNDYSLESLIKIDTGFVLACIIRTSGFIGNSFIANNSLDIFCFDNNGTLINKTINNDLGGYDSSNSNILAVEDGFYIASSMNESELIKNEHGVYVSTSIDDKKGIFLKKFDNSGNEVSSIKVADLDIKPRNLTNKPVLTLHNDNIYIFWDSNVKYCSSYFMRSYNMAGEEQSDINELFSLEPVSSTQLSILDFNDYLFITLPYLDECTDQIKVIGQYYDFNGNSLGGVNFLSPDTFTPYSDSKTFTKSGKSNIASVFLQTYDDNSTNLVFQLYEEKNIKGSNLSVKITNPVVDSYESKANFDLSGYALDSNIDRVEVLYWEEGSTQENIIYSADGKNINGEILTFNILPLEKGKKYKLKLQAWDKAANYSSDIKNITRSDSSIDILDFFELDKTFYSNQFMPKISFSLTETSMVNLVVKNKMNKVLIDEDLGSVKEKTDYQLDTSGLPDGEYIVEISIISGRDRYSNYLNMVIDNTPPVISIPDFGSEFSDQSTVNFSADIEEANLDNYSVYLKDDNGILVSTLKEGNSPGTITDINFKPQTITDGEYFIEIVANDSSGNISKKAKSFTINHSGTEITLNSPVSNSINNKNIVFKGLLSDPSGVERYEIYVVRNNHTSLAFSESGNNIDYSYDSTQYYEKVYTMDIEIVAYDNIGNSTSLKRNIIIDNEPPTIGLTYKVQPYFVNGSLFINTNNGILLNAESNDIYSELDSIFYSINNRQWTKYNGSINIDTEGFHNIEYYAVDTIGNSSTIHTESIKVDNTDPDSIISVDDVTPSNINNMDFVNYYNKVDNWVSGEIGNGQLEIKEPVSLMQDIQIPITAEIIVVENGGIITNGFTLSYTDEFSYNEDLDPVKIYQQRVQTVLMIINQLLLE